METMLEEGKTKTIEQITNEVHLFIESLLVNEVAVQELGKVATFVAGTGIHGEYSLPFGSVLRVYPHYIEDNREIAMFRNINALTDPDHHSQPDITTDNPLVVDRISFTVTPSGEAEFRLSAWRLNTIEANGFREPIQAKAKYLLPVLTSEVVNIETSE